MWHPLPMCTRYTRMGRKHLSMGRYMLWVHMLPLTWKTGDMEALHPTPQSFGLPILAKLIPRQPHSRNPF